MYKMHRKYTKAYKKYIENVQMCRKDTETNKNSYSSQNEQKMLKVCKNEQKCTKVFK